MVRKMSKYNLELTENDAVILVALLGTTAKLMTQSPMPEEAKGLLDEHPVTSMLRLKARIEGQINSQRKPL